MSEVREQAFELGRFGVSAGTAVLLGLLKARIQEVPTTAHFLFGEACTRDCAFCAQARGAAADRRHLSRITWPLYSCEEVSRSLKEAIESGAIKRVCAQVVECGEAPSQALEFVRRVRRLSASVLLSVSVAPSSVSRVRRYMEAGVTNVGLPLDAATSSIYSAAKGGSEGSYDQAWRVIEECARTWPGKISTHLIVGLGETEREAVEFLIRARDAGVTVGLFAFTPVRGTAMESASPPDVASYRRVQIASYYLREGGGPDGIEFQDGRIVRVRLGGKTLEETLEGRPFETSGCLYCNRPYYNERPGQVMMNYPRRLSRQETLEALLASGLELPGDAFLLSGKEVRS